VVVGFDCSNYSLMWLWVLIVVIIVLVLFGGGYKKFIKGRVR